MAVELPTVSSNVDILVCCCEPIEDLLDFPNNAPCCLDAMLNIEEGEALAIELARKPPQEFAAAVSSLNPLPLSSLVLRHKRNHAVAKGEQPNARTNFTKSLIAMRTLRLEHRDHAQAIVEVKSISLVLLSKIANREFPNFFNFKTRYAL